MKVVIDTNVILDLWLYIDPRVEALRQDLECGGVQWVATHAMKEELKRVLQYEHIQVRLAKAVDPVAQLEAEGAPGEDLRHTRLTGQFIVEHMERLAQLEDPSPKARYVCKDADDQKFIDLAQTHQALLISKDKAVLCMKNRMAKVGVKVLSVYERGERQPL